MKFHEIMTKSVTQTKNKHLRSYRNRNELYRTYPYYIGNKDQIYYIYNSPTFLIFFLRKAISKSKVGRKKFLCFSIFNYLIVNLFVDVNLGDYKLSVEEVKTLAKIKNIKKIKYFSLRDGQINNLSNLGLIDLSTVESIKFSSVPIEFVYKLILDDILRNLKSLTLPPKIRIGKYKLELITSKLKHLKKLNLTNTCFEESGVNFLSKFSDKFCNIEKLNLSGYRIRNFFLSRFVEVMWVNLKKLILNNCEIRDFELLFLLRGDLNHLTDMELNDNLITDYGFNQILKVTQINLKNLKRFSLLDNKLTSEVMSLLKKEIWGNVTFLINFEKPNQSFRISL